MVTDAETTVPWAKLGGVTEVVKLEYCDAMDPGPGATLKQLEELLSVPKVTLVISSSALDVAFDVQ